MGALSAYIVSVLICTLFGKANINVIYFINQSIYFCCKILYLLSGLILAIAGFLFYINAKLNLPSFDEDKIKYFDKKTKFSTDIYYYLPGLI